MDILRSIDRSIDRKFYVDPASGRIMLDRSIDAGISIYENIEAALSAGEGVLWRCRTLLLEWDLPHVLCEGAA